MTCSLAGSIRTTVVRIKMGDTSYSYNCCTNKEGDASYSYNCCTNKEGMQVTLIRTTVVRGASYSYNGISNH